MLEQFFDHRTEVELERSYRIRLSVAAFAYEFGHELIMDDGTFDSLAKKVRPEMSTTEDVTDPAQADRYKKLDEFFRQEFSADTGQWIHKHPELPLIEAVYFKHYHGKMNTNNGA
jgi:hypothetical protein